MDIIQHILGICSDNHLHFDLTDYLYNYPAVHEIIYNLQYSIRVFFIRILSWIF
jgi:hypothetical protein